MNRDAILGLVRHILTTAGGVLASKGAIGESDAEIAAGAIVTLVGIIWSVLEKRNR